MLKCGVDIIEVNRIDRAILRHGDRFFTRFFTPGELIEARGHTPALAARFAAKEAVAKALGTGIGPVGWKDIEIQNGPQRQPLVRLHAEAERIADALGLREWSISLSHTHEHAMAIAVAWGELAKETGA
jgi:holo-[acyl-carrier protein] synthase